MKQWTTTKFFSNYNTKYQWGHRTLAWLSNVPPSSNPNSDKTWPRWSRPEVECVEWQRPFITQHIVKLRIILNLPHVVEYFTKPIAISCLKTNFKKALVSGIEPPTSWEETAWTKIEMFKGKIYIHSSL